MNAIIKNISKSYTIDANGNLNSTIEQKLITLIPSIGALHRACEEVEEYSLDWYEENRTYNEVVVNGDHRPETFREAIFEAIQKVNIDESIKKAYWRACWWDIDHCGIFQYPPRWLVAAMMFRL